MNKYINEDVEKLNWLEGVAIRCIEAIGQAYMELDEGHIDKAQQILREALAFEKYKEPTLPASEVKENDKTNN